MTDWKCDICEEPIIDEGGVCSNCTAEAMELGIDIMIKNKNKIRCADWNMRHPVGTKVIVKRDDGSETRGKTTHEAMVAGGSAVVFVDTISGFFLLSRVRVDDERRTRP